MKSIICIVLLFVIGIFAVCEEGTEKVDPAGCYTEKCNAEGTFDKTATPESCTCVYNGESVAAGASIQVTDGGVCYLKTCTGAGTEGEAVYSGQFTVEQTECKDPESSKPESSKAPGCTTTEMYTDPAGCYTKVCTEGEYVKTATPESCKCVFEGDYVATGEYVTFKDGGVCYSKKCIGSTAETFSAKWGEATTSECTPDESKEPTPECSSTSVYTDPAGCYTKVCTEGVLVKTATPDSCKCSIGENYVAKGDSTVVTDGGKCFKKTCLGAATVEGVVSLYADWETEVVSCEEKSEEVSEETSEEKEKEKEETGDCIWAGAPFNFGDVVYKEACYKKVCADNEQGYEKIETSDSEDCKAKEAEKPAEEKKEISEFDAIVRAKEGTTDEEFKKYFEDLLDAKADIVIEEVTKNADGTITVKFSASDSEGRNKEELQGDLETNAKTYAGSNFQLVEISEAQTGSSGIPQDAGVAQIAASFCALFVLIIC